MSTASRGGKCRAADAGPKRREVTDDEIRGAMADPRNVGVIRSVLASYAGQIHADDLDRCGLHAVWRALGYHRDGMGQAFTTNLHRFLNFECRRQLKRQRRRGCVTLDEVPEPAEPPGREEEVRDEMRLVREAMSSLSRAHRELVEEHHLQGMSLDEMARKRRCGKETVREQLVHAFGRLRQLCCGEVPPDAAAAAGVARWHGNHAASCRQG